MLLRLKTVAESVNENENVGRDTGTTYLIAANIIAIITAYTYGVPVMEDTMNQHGINLFTYREDTFKPDILTHLCYICSVTGILCWTWMFRSTIGTDNMAAKVFKAIFLHPVENFNVIIAGFLFILVCAAPMMLKRQTMSYDNATSETTCEHDELATRMDDIVSSAEASSVGSSKLPLSHSLYHETEIKRLHEKQHPLTKPSRQGKACGNKNNRRQPNPLERPRAKPKISSEKFGPITGFSEYVAALLKAGSNGSSTKLKSNGIEGKKLPKIKKIVKNEGGKRDQTKIDDSRIVHASKPKTEADKVEFSPAGAGIKTRSSSPNRKIKPKVKKQKWKSTKSPANFSNKRSKGMPHIKDTFKSKGIPMHSKDDYKDKREKNAANRSFDQKEQASVEVERKTQDSVRIKIKPVTVSKLGDTIFIHSVQNKGNKLNKGKTTNATSQTAIASPGGGNVRPNIGTPKKLDQSGPTKENAKINKHNITAPKTVHNTQPQIEKPKRLNPAVHKRKHLNKATTSRPTEIGKTQPNAKIPQHHPAHAKHNLDKAIASGPATIPKRLNPAVHKEKHFNQTATSGLSTTGNMSPNAKIPQHHPAHAKHNLDKAIASGQAIIPKRLNPAVHKGKLLNKTATSGQSPGGRLQPNTKIPQHHHPAHAKQHNVDKAIASGPAIIPKRLNPAAVHKEKHFNKTATSGLSTTGKLQPNVKIPQRQNPKLNKHIGSSPATIHMSKPKPAKIDNQAQIKVKNFNTQGKRNIRNVQPASKPVKKLMHTGMSPHLPKNKKLGIDKPGADPPPGKRIHNPKFPIRRKRASIERLKVSPPPHKRTG